MRQFLPTLGVAFLVGCTGLVAPRPPTYSEECVPSSDYYLKMASSLRDVTPLEDVPQDPQEAYAKALVYLEEHEVSISTKGDGDPTADFTTTLPGQIFLSAKFSALPIQYQAATLWHEIVHVNQWERMGKDVFIQHYAYSEGRWALEVPAYRQSLRLVRKFGMDPSAYESYKTGRFNALYDKYALGTMPRECAEEHTLAIWGLDDA